MSKPKDLVILSIVEQWGETMIMAGVTIGIKSDGNDIAIVIDSESGLGVSLPSETEFVAVQSAVISVLQDQSEEYLGYTIKPKMDFGNQPHLVNGVYVRHGWVVVKDGCNIMPGATWFSLKSSARTAIDILIETDGESVAFWEKMRESE